MNKYSYKDFKDKTKEGIIKEVSEGIVKMAFFMEQTYGFPHEIFSEELKKLNDAQKLIMYMNFRNKHPKLFR